ncbi:hypothetical protein DB32_002224 [Sandaracinus amylolyticus]|uniref:Uncharacterized protein n=2 Tax=Sandaracinus amylolyticus TaxID=927083 RepID=A0A0F6W1G0_9BACT|nr:hypothetical protein DB32_002224 [Sandaracinus amylolyticus]
MVYAHQLPPENDPEAVALARSWIDAARAAQRPGRAMGYAIPSTIIGIVLWGELNRWTGFAMHWYGMAGSAVALGVVLGRPCRSLGALFDRRWAALLFVLGFAMGALGDLYATTALVAARDGIDWLTVITHADVGGWIAGRTPLDWIVAGAGGAGAALAGRPPMDERQLFMQARIDVAAARLDAQEREDAGDAEDAA